MQRNLMTTSPKVFRHFLSYLYSGELKENLCPEELRQMVDLAETYKPRGLRSWCAKALKASINVDNVFNIHKTAEAFGMTGIAKRAFRFALSNGYDVINSNGFYDINAVTLNKFLGSNKLQCEEIELFKALVRWGEAKVNEQFYLDESLDNIIQPHLQNIRFPTMTVFQIGTYVHATRLLKDAELLAIYKYLSNPSEEVGMVGRFSTERRETRERDLFKDAGEFENGASSGTKLEMVDFEMEEGSNSHDFLTPDIIKTWSIDSEKLPAVNTSIDVSNLSSSVSSIAVSDELAISVSTRSTEILNNEKFNISGQENVSNCGPQGQYNMKKQVTNPDVLNTSTVNVRSLDSENRRVVNQSLDASYPSSSTVSSIAVSEEFFISVSGSGTEVRNIKEGQESVTTCQSQNMFKKNQTKQVAFKEAGSSDSDDDLFERSIHIKETEILSWDNYVSRWNARTEDCDDMKRIDLVNVKIKSFYPKVVMPQIKSCNLDLEIDIPDKFSRFERTFDLRRFLFFQKDHDVLWKCDELWDMNIPMSVTINGVTFFKISKPLGFLTISYPQDAEEILSGLGKYDKLFTLCLLKAPVPPDLDKFPRRSLRRVIMYSMNVRNAYEVGIFFHGCKNLETLVFSPAVAVDEAASDKQPSCIDIKNQLSPKLMKITLFNVCLYYVPSVPFVSAAAAGIAKNNVSTVYLDQCSWLVNMVDCIHEIFPNVQRFAVRQRDADDKFKPQKLSERHQISTRISARLINNLLKIKSLKWIRIWGKTDSILEIENEETDQIQSAAQSPVKLHVTPTKRTPIKNSPLKMSPISAAAHRNRRRRADEPGFITNEEIVQAQDFLESCGLKRTAYNYTLEKIEDLNGEKNGIESNTRLISCSWKGVEWNDTETLKSDDGYWDSNDQQEFSFYELENFYKDYKVYQNYFSDPTDPQMELECEID